MIKIIDSIQDMSILTDGNYWTFEGLDISDESIAELLHEFGISENTTIYVVKGKTMNKLYDLHGDNAYKDDLNIVSIRDIPLDNENLTLYGASRFNDIIEFNEMMKEE